MFNKKKLKASMILKGFSTEKLAEKMSKNPSYLYRRFNGTSEFTRKDIQQIVDILELDTNGMNDIFFAEQLA
jgi:transcriptional regulator with XRE-family HTH domain